MPRRRFRRRKAARPQEITAAAFSAFADNGYAATRVDDVARRAGVSKGLVYLYFRTKEEIFKAVVRSVVVPRIDKMIAIVERNDMSSEAFLRGPFLEFAKTLPGSRIAVIIRLMIAEGPKYPDLIEFYRDNVVDRGLAGIRRLLERGVEAGEFRRSAVTGQPQLFVMPVVFSVIFRLLFDAPSAQTDRLIETQLDLLIAHLKGASE